MTIPKAHKKLKQYISSVKNDVEGIYVSYNLNIYNFSFRISGKYTSKLKIVYVKRKDVFFVPCKEQTVIILYSKTQTS